jgi:DNA-binding transcriptional regulator YiaG
VIRLLSGSDTRVVALHELRTRAGFSQEAQARELRVALQTVVLWETKRAPAGIMLHGCWRWLNITATST